MKEYSIRSRNFLQRSSWLLFREQARAVILPLCLLVECALLVDCRHFYTKLHPPDHNQSVHIFSNVSRLFYDICNTSSAKISSCLLYVYVLRTHSTYIQSTYMILGRLVWNVSLRNTYLAASGTNRQTTGSSIAHAVVPCILFICTLEKKPDAESPTRNLSVVWLSDASARAHGKPVMSSGRRPVRTRCARKENRCTVFGV